jgi:hypothetical protein
MIVYLSHEPQKLLPFCLKNAKDIENVNDILLSIRMKVSGDVITYFQSYLNMEYSTNQNEKIYINSKFTLIKPWPSFLQKYIYQAVSLYHSEILHELFLSAHVHFLFYVHSLFPFYCKKIFLDNA